MKQLIIIAISLLLLAGTTTARQEQQPIPTYVIKVWVTGDPAREVGINTENRAGWEWSARSGITPSTIYINADKPLDVKIESPDGEMLNGQFRFQFRDKDEWLEDETGPKMSFTAPARSE